MMTVLDDNENLCICVGLWAENACISIEAKFLSILAVHDN